MSEQFELVEKIKKTLTSPEFRVGFMASSLSAMTLTVVRTRLLPKLITRFPILSRFVGRFV